MINPVEFLVAAALALFLLLPVVWAWRLVWLYLFPRSVISYPEAPWPRAAVILALRGADPSLVDCLTGLLEQDYPHYQVHIIIDSREDPAWARVQEILAAHAKKAGQAFQPDEGQVRLESLTYLANPPVEVCVRTLDSRRDTCSLKVSAQIQALRGLDAAVEVVAFIDADVIPGRAWLRSLVRPLTDPRVGAATGIRWYAPQVPTWGNLVRYFWNAAACTQMYVFHIPWGGSLALHARVFRDSDLQEQWGQSFGEDTRAYGVLRALGLELRYVPEVTMVNAESIDLTGCCTFIRRQLFSARMNHALWAGVLLANLGTGLALLGAAAVLLGGMMNGFTDWVLGAGAGLGLYGLGLTSALVVAEQRIRALARRQGRDVPVLAFSWKWLPAVLLTQFLHFGCLFSALCLRRIDWRGITYAVESSGKLRLLEYRPYRAGVQDSFPSQSLL